MNKTDEIVVGLDIGTTKIAAIVGRMNEHGKLEILGWGKSESTGVNRGVVTHITPTVEAIEKAIEMAESKTDIDIKSVNVGIAGQHIKSLQHRGSKIRKSYEDEILQHDIDELVSEMYNLVVVPGESIIDVIPQEFCIDNEQGITNPIGMAGGRLEADFHIITGNVSAIKNIYKCVTRADLEVENLILEPLASSDSVLSQEEKEVGVVLVDIGGGTTDVAIFKEGIIRHTAVIPFGGEVITKDIKDGCSIIKKQAELLKVKFGSALIDKSMSNDIISIPGLKDREPKEISMYNLTNIIKARMEEIIEQVYFEIRNSGYENKLTAGIVVTGGGAQLRNVRHLFEFVTGMDVRIGYPTEHLAGDDEDVKNPSFATGVGLILKGFERIKNKQNANVNSTVVSEPVAKEKIDGKRKNILGDMLDKFKNIAKDMFEDDVN
jgi:cell division protein FtsA